MMSHMIEPLESLSEEALERLSIEIVDGAPWFALVDERFGIDAAHFDDFVVLQSNPKYLHLAKRGLLAPMRPRPDSVGMPFMRIVMKFPKLSTAAAMAFGIHASRNAIDADQPQLDAFLSRKPFWPDLDQLEQCTGPGQVIIRHAGFALGIGLLRFPPLDADDPRPFIESMFPKAWAIASHRSAFSSESS